MRPTVDSLPFLLMFFATTGLISMGGIDFTEATSTYYYVFILIIVMERHQVLIR
jgi:hypothetical protein